MSEQAFALDRPVSADIAHLDMARRVACLKQYGTHAMSFSTMQPDMHYFDVPGMGYIAYAKHYGMRFALSDPICSPQHREQLLDRFLAVYPKAMFAQVSKPVVDHLHNRYGYYGTQFGSELKVDLTNWSTRGSKKQVIRTAINQARSQDIEIRESGYNPEAKRISEAWIRTRRCKNNEIRFLIRPMLMDYREGTRYFYAYLNGEAVAFAFFDPIYQNGKLVAYVPNISRSSANFKQGLWYALMVHAMEVFKSEGIQYLDLGLVPLMLADEIESQESRILRKSMSVIRDRMDFLYNFKGLEFAKSRFQGDVHKTYCCHRNALPGMAMFAMFRLTRII